MTDTPRAALPAPDHFMVRAPGVGNESVASAQSGRIGLAAMPVVGSLAHRQP
jgi:hypothetical protein